MSRFSLQEMKKKNIDSNTSKVLDKEIERVQTLLNQTKDDGEKFLFSSKSTFEDNTKTLYIISLF